MGTVQAQGTTMDIAINFESAAVRTQVVLHAWEPLGHIWHIKADPDSLGALQVSADWDDSRPSDHSLQIPVSGRAQVGER